MKGQNLNYDPKQQRLKNLRKFDSKKLAINIPVIVDNDAVSYGAHEIIIRLEIIFFRLTWHLNPDI